MLLESDKTENGNKLFLVVRAAHSANLYQYLSIYIYINYIYE